MYVLFMFGPLIEQKIGPKKFLFIYLAAGIIASFLSSLLYPIILNTPLRALGASGAIMGILGVVIILMPDLKVLFFFMIPMTLRTAAVIIAFIEVFGIFAVPGIANMAHLIGMACGLLYGLRLKKQKTQFNKKFYSKTHLDTEDIEDYFKSGRI